MADSKDLPPERAEKERAEVLRLAMAKLDNRHDRIVDEKAVESLYKCSGRTDQDLSERMRLAIQASGLWLIIGREGFSSGLLKINISSIET